MQDIDDILAEGAAFDQLHGWNQHAFLEAFRRDRIVVAWHVTAHIVPMPHGGEETEDRAISIEWTHQLEIGKVRAALIGIVEYVGVARSQIAVPRGLVDHQFDGEGHGADKYRQSGFPLN